MITRALLACPPSPLGATGSAMSPDGLGDGYTDNGLHFMTVSLGATLR